MKQNEIATIVVVVSVSLILSWFGGRAILKPDESKETPVEVIQPISTEFTLPDEKIFNKDAVNLAERIKIGEKSSTKVFE